MAAALLRPQPRVSVLPEHKRYRHGASRRQELQQRQATRLRPGWCPVRRRLLRGKWPDSVPSRELAALRWRLFRGVPIDVRARKMRETFVRLGPAFIKAGQALATRPDRHPTASVQGAREVTVRDGSIPIQRGHVSY